MSGTGIHQDKYSQAMRLTEALISASRGEETQMPTHEEKSAVRVFGDIFDLSKTYGHKSSKLAPRAVQHLAEGAILKHLEVDETLEVLKAQIEQIRKEAQCEHAKPDWRIMIGAPRGDSSSSTVYRTVRCICIRCGKELFEKTGEEVLHA